MTSFQHEPSDPYSLSSDRVYAVSQDRSGAIWVGTFGRRSDRVEIVVDDVGRFCGGAQQSDDMAVMVIKT